MMKFFTKLFLLGVIVGVFSCDDKGEAEPDFIIGTWELDDVVFSDAPTAYATYNEGETSALFGEDEYTIEFSEDMTFERELDGITLTNGGNVEDEGEYSYDGEFLELDPIDEITGLGYEFDVEEPITESDMILSYTDSYFSLTDADLEAVIDTVELQTVYDSIFDIHAQLISVKNTLYFDKK